MRGTIRFSLPFLGRVLHCGRGEENRQVPEVLVPGTWPHLIPTSALHAFQSMLTPGYLLSPRPHHLLQATLPSLCFCSWQCSWWLGDFPSGESISKLQLTQVGI